MTQVVKYRVVTAERKKWLAGIKAIDLEKVLINKRVHAKCCIAQHCAAMLWPEI